YEEERILYIRRTIDALKLGQQGRVVTSQPYPGRLQRVRCFYRRFGNPTIKPLKIFEVDSGFESRWSPQSECVRTFVNMGAGNDKLRSLRSLGAKQFSDLLNVIVKQPNQIGGAQHYRPLPCLKSQAADIKRIMYGSRKAVVAKPGQVNRLPGHLRRNDGLSRAGPHRTDSRRREQEREKVSADQNASWPTHDENPECLDAQRAYLENEHGSLKHAQKGVFEHGLAISAVDGPFGGFV